MIVDLRVENVKDIFYQVVFDDVIFIGKIILLKILIEVRMVFLVQQVEFFVFVVLDFSKRLIYVYSKEGVWRIFVMVFRWKQYIICSVTKEILVLKELKCQEVVEIKVRLNVDKEVFDQWIDRVFEINEIDSSFILNQSKEFGSNECEIFEFNMVSDFFKV